MQLDGYRLGKLITTGLTIGIRIGTTEDGKRYAITKFDLSRSEGYLWPFR